MTWESSSSTSPRNYRAPITLEVLPDEIGELPESDTYVRVEYIPPGETSGQHAALRGSLGMAGSSEGGQGPGGVAGVATEGGGEVDRPGAAEHADREVAQAHKSVSGSRGPVAPVFKLCFRGSPPFVGVSDLDASAASARRGPPRSAGVAVAAAVGRRPDRPRR
jgi:hypothetical protein